MGRGETVEVMELHRSEMVSRNDGALVPVTFFGLGVHEGTLRADILNLKYHRHRGVAQELAEQLSLRLGHLNMLDGMDMITWAPTTHARKTRRGYDQAELLARHFGAFVALPVRSLLRRTSQQSQSGLQREDRLVGPQFVAKPRVKNRNIVVIDDVTTTGATFRAVAKALANVGCSQILCVALSWRP